MATLDKLDIPKIIADDRQDFLQDGITNQRKPMEIMSHLFGQDLNPANGRWKQVTTKGQYQTLGTPCFQAALMLTVGELIFSKPNPDDV